MMKFFWEHSFPSEMGDEIFKTIKLCPNLKHNIGDEIFVRSHCPNKKHNIGDDNFVRTQLSKSKV